MRGTFILKKKKTWKNVEKDMKDLFFLTIFIKRDAIHRITNRKIIINREILRDIRIFLIGETVRILVSNPKIFEFDS